MRELYLETIHAHWGGGIIPLMGEHVWQNPPRQTEILPPSSPNWHLAIPTLLANCHPTPGHQNCHVIPPPRRPTVCIYAREYLTRTALKGEDVSCDSTAGTC